jgi:CheY-like chemotaxis protein
MDASQTDASDETPPAGLLLCRDLFFTSKITGTAQALGMKFEVVDSVSEAASRIAVKPYRCVFVNLDEPGTDVAALLRGVPAERRVPVIAFAAHVAELVIDAAQRAGCDQVVSRGLLSSTLPDLLRRFVT